MVGRNQSWSNLPQELLSAIANKLTSNSNPLYILTFRSVCHSWRSSCPPLSRPSFFSPLLPLSIPRPPSDVCRLVDSSFLSVTVIYALTRPIGTSEVGFSSLAPNNWILFLSQYNPGKVSLRNPFFKGSYPIPINFPKNINLIDFHVRELGRFHNLTTTCQNDERGYRLNKPRFRSVVNVDKVVLVPNGLAAIAVFDDGKLGMIRLGVGINEVGQCENSKWKIIRGGRGLDDIVEYKGRVLGIDRRGRTYEIDYLLYKMNVVAPSIDGGGGWRKRLVESLGLLYLVVRCNVGPAEADTVNEEKRKTKFKVYELNEGSNKWSEIRSLGDRSFLFGIDFSVSVSAQELGSCGKNCILFGKQSFIGYSRENDCDMVLRKLENSDLYVGVYHLQDAGNFGAVESYLGYADTFWPPPPWIWSIDRLKRLGIVETAIDEIVGRIPENFKTQVKELTVKGPRDCGGDFWLLNAVREVLKLKKMVIELQEDETEYMNADKMLQEAISIHGLGDSIDMLNQVDRLLEKARTSRLGCPDEVQFDTGHAPASRLTADMLRKRDDVVFHFEEHASAMERSLKARLEPILTGSCKSTFYLQN